MQKNKLVKSKSSIIKSRILNVCGISGFFLLWQTLLWTGVLNERHMPSPMKIVDTFVYKLFNKAPEGAVLFDHIVASFQVALTGFFLAVVVGVILGTSMGWFKPIEKFVKPLFEVIRPISPIAWIPLTILWLGIGVRAKGFIIFFSALMPCTINSYTGVKDTPEIFINIAKTCGASHFQIFRKVALPYALPMIFAGVRISLNSAWATLVGAEMLASNVGLGFLILQGRQFSKADIIIVGMVTIAFIGFLIATVLTKVEERFIKWRMG